jgi:hypothetical protein
MPRSNKIILTVIALIAITFVIINEANIRPKLNLVNDAKKLKEVLENMKLPEDTKQIIIDNSYKIDNKTYDFKGYGVIFLEENYSFFLQRNDMCTMKLPYSEEIMFQDEPCPEYRLFNNIKIPLKIEGHGLYEEDGEFVFKGSESVNFITYNNKEYRILKFNDDGIIITRKSSKDNNKLKEEDFNKTIIDDDSYIDNYEEYITVIIDKNKKLEGSGRKNDPFIINE